MERERVPLMLKLRRWSNSAGELVLQYPAFDQIAPHLRAGLRWEAYIDYCGGWFHDQLSPLGQVDEYNADPDVQFAGVIADARFALEARQRFPDDVTLLSPEEFEEFYESRCAIVQPDELVNTTILDRIRARNGLSATPGQPTASMSPSDKRALDPNDPTPGIQVNWRKQCKTMLAKTGTKLIDIKGK